MLISQIYCGLQAFTVIATGLEDGRVIFANQSKTRPLKPFVSISINNFKSISGAIIRSMDDAGKQTIVIPKTCVVRFQSFSDRLHESEELLERLYNAFATELRNTIFGGELALHRTLKSVSAVPVTLNAEKESQAIVELEFGYNSRIEDDVGIIETIKISDGISQKQYGVEL